MAITHGRIRACAIPETTVHPKEKYQGGGACAEAQSMSHKQG
jgi:hypothetical protein